MRKKQNGEWKLSDTDWFYFSFYNPSCFFLWSEFIRVQFYCIFIFLFDPSSSSWSGPDWRSELIRSDFCTCLFSSYYFPWLYFVDLFSVASLFSLFYVIREFHRFLHWGWANSQVSVFLHVHCIVCMAVMNFGQNSWRKTYFVIKLARPFTHRF